jgi:uncharacterized protein (TIGR02145 family)
MRSLVLATLFILIYNLANAQKVGIGTNSPKAALDVTSTTNGFLPPRMTSAQRDAIANPEPGLLIYCTDCVYLGEWQGYNGQKWVKMNGELVSATIPSINVGMQSWSSQNLDVVRYRNGDPVPQVTDPTLWTNLTTGAWCWYNNDSATYSFYGRLYNWYAVNDPRGLAPQGWRIPTKSDWNKLIKFLDNAADTACLNCNVSVSAGEALKSDSAWVSNTTGSNIIGYNALPGGSRWEGAFDGQGQYGTWWSADEKDSANATSLNIYLSNFFTIDPKTMGASVRVFRENITSKSITPIVNTGYPSFITLDTLITEGSVTADGGSPVIARGICWGTFPNPTIANSNTTNEGRGLGTFTSVITNFPTDSVIYIRAYATNSQGTSYGRIDSIFSTTYLAISNGYFYHPSVPRTIVSIDKEIEGLSPISWRIGLGDLGPSYQVVLTLDTLTNKVTITTGNSGTPAIVQFDNGLPTTTPGYSPQWPRSAECNNTFDPVTRRFKLRYGYMGGTGYRVSEEIIQLF